MFIACFIACFILLVIAPLPIDTVMMTLNDLRRHFGYLLQHFLIQVRH